MLHTFQNCCYTVGVKESQHSNIRPSKIHCHIILFGLYSFSLQNVGNAFIPSVCALVKSSHRLNLFVLDFHCRNVILSGLHVAFHAGRSVISYSDQICWGQTFASQTKVPAEILSQQTKVTCTNLVVTEFGGASLQN